MNKASRKVQRTYLTLLLLNTLAASLIWGINTLFLLDAGLNNTEAFAANAFFTFGFMIFEIPTGVVADLRGRRIVLPARRDYSDALHVALFVYVVPVGSVLGLGVVVDVARARLYIFFGRDGSMARLMRWHTAASRSNWSRYWRKVKLSKAPRC